MTTERTTEAWIPACDLCGSLRHAVLTRTATATIRRCRDCGLIGVEHLADAGTAYGATISDEMICEELQRYGGGRAVLVIGAPSEAVVSAAREAGAALTALLPPGQAAPAGINARGASLESAVFPPDSFHLIIVPRGLDGLGSPSLVFDRARLWLVPGGRLLAGALNYDGLPARLRRRSWLQRYAPTAEHMFTPSVLRDYARRFGFQVSSIRSRAHTRDVAAAMLRNPAPNWAAEMAVAPIALAASAFGMGIMIVAEMRREQLVTRPLLRSAEEAAEAAPGLAPALYTGVQMREEIRLSTAD